MMDPIVTEASRTSALLSWHQRHQAQIDQIFGWTMAKIFSNQQAEYRQVRQKVGLFDFTFYGAIRIAGSESAQFLQGLVTNDVKTLPKQHWQTAAFLTGHGKVKAFCQILSLGNAFLLITDPQTHEKVFNLLFPLSYAGDFQVEDVSPQYRALSVQGPEAESVMREVCFEPLTPMDAKEWRMNSISGHQALIRRTSHTGENGFDIHCSEDVVCDIWDFLLLKGGFFDLQPVGFEAFNVLRVEAGIPLYGVDIDESNMMLESGLTEAVSFQKGCYTGQEAVAMATYRGHVSKRLSGLLVEGQTVPQAGDKILAGENPVGQITSAVYSEALRQVICLGLIKYGHFEEGTELQIQTEEQLLQASVTSLPFYSSK